MRVGEHVHWYIGGERCQLDCIGCFSPISTYNQKDEPIPLLAKYLTEKRVVKKVTLTGGEPLLEKNLVDVLRILKKAGIYISIHTNGIALTADKLNQFKGLVDDIALPLDSLDEKVQQELRGERFLPTHRRLFEIGEQIQKNDILLGYHTLFTSINHSHVSQIYEKLEMHGFDYWRIYEMNSELPRQKIFYLAKLAQNDLEQKSLAGRLKRIAELSYCGSPEKAYTDGVLACLLLEEEKFRKESRDKRVKFVATHEISCNAYLFLENNGNLSVYNDHYTEFRSVGGNALIEGMYTALERINTTLRDGTDLFIGDRWTEVRYSALPFWAVIGEITPIDEEIEQIDPSYFPLANHLAELWAAREARINKGSVKDSVTWAKQGMEFIGLS